MTLRRFSRRLIAGLLLTLAAAPMRAASKVPPFIPMPNSFVQDTAAPFVISQKHTFITADTALLRPAADALRRVLKERTGMDIALSPKGAKGSITIDEDLMDAAGLVAGEHVHVVNNYNCERIETYVIRGPRCTGCICLNGAAARKFQPGDEVIIMAYAAMTPEEAATFEPKIVFPDGANNNSLA